MSKFFNVICIFVYISKGSCLSDVTADVFTDNVGVLAAFGDFNGDKHADVFVISANGKFCSCKFIIFTLQSTLFITTVCCQQYLTLKSELAVIKKYRILESKSFFRYRVDQILVQNPLLTILTFHVDCVMSALDGMTAGFVATHVMSGFT